MGMAFFGPALVLLTLFLFLPMLLTVIMGNENNLYFTFGGSQTIARVSKYEISGIGDKIDFVFNPAKLHFFDKNTEVRYV